MEFRGATKVTTRRSHMEGVTNQTLQDGLLGTHGHQLGNLVRKDTQEISREPNPDSTS